MNDKGCSDLLAATAKWSFIKLEPPRVSVVYIFQILINSNEFKTNQHWEEVYHFAHWDAEESEVYIVTEVSCSSGLLREYLQKVDNKEDEMVFLTISLCL